ncbi:hypothetical protein HZS_8078 [Henneguya salminicola]|nr:hypothetical protein HZS_8078 [Henneguya salminicola]
MSMTTCFKKNKKLFLSHVFCPPGSILSCFESFENYLIENCLMDQIMEIFKYVEDNFIGRLPRKIRQQPLFAIYIWNQYARTMGNVPRSNNNLPPLIKTFLKRWKFGKRSNRKQMLKLTKKTNATTK